MAGAGENVAVDANGRFDLATALAYGRAMQGYGLFWYEEPGDPLDYQLNAVLAEHYPGALATGENLFSAIDGRNLLRYGGLRPDRDWVQLDPALSYGLTEYLRFLDVAKQMGWSRRRFIPHGGHQLALNIAAGLQLGGSESYPGVFQPYGGFAELDPHRRRLRAPPRHARHRRGAAPEDVRRDAQAPAIGVTTRSGQ